MTPEHIELCKRLRSGRWIGETTGKPAADTIEALAAEVERLKAALYRGVGAHFWYSIGYGACWADVTAKNDFRPPFLLTKEGVEKTFELAINDYDGDIDSDLADVLNGGRNDA